MGIISKLHRHSFKLNIIVLFFFTFALNEYFAYYDAYRRFWPTVNSKAKRTVLLVADPQIQGYRDEPSSLLGYLTRWDSDRYLSISFQWLLWAYKPSIIIFLGDLIDEASTTDDEEVYKSYVDRFYSIYPKDSAPRTIYIPGDNDIGGEGLDMVTEKKLKRFNTYFNGCGAFFQVSKRIQVFTYDPLKDTFPFINKKDSKVKIFASHRPITTLIEPEDYRFKFAGRPSVIFSAHHHYGSVYKLFLQGGQSPEKVVSFSKYNATESIKWHMHDNQDIVYEINVPTCSYRMGVDHMAFGLFTFHKKIGFFEYQNLWLPNRFSALGRYFLAVAITVLYSVYYLYKSKLPGGGRFFNVKYSPLSR
ncbi:uncharacterized protein [Lepeophtheirus salmonis]|uniref:uncharacterized protein n=1 Tax=Lepeophtheirus salmonis TaxID=72036 RepID=UPI001AE13CCB|nr:metallophosphoesterase 1-like [Lepeophtheirus salmonis]